MAEFIIDPELIEFTLRNTSQPSLVEDNFEIVRFRVEEGVISPDLGYEYARAVSRVALNSYRSKKQLSTRS